MIQIKQMLSYIIPLGLIASAFIVSSCASPGSASVNRSPVIERLYSEYRVVYRGDSAIIESISVDPDGDTLSYYWETTGGIISGNGPVVKWTSPDDLGSFVFKVTVKDGRGGEVSGQLPIDVTVLG